jgi:RNA polymerase sigma-70 factor, ECF subfamily
MSAPDVHLEEDIQALRAKGQWHQAATMAIEGYGPQLFGFLVALLRDEEAASEVFSQTCEDLWAGFRRFEGRSSMRTWIYALARHAASRYRRSPHRRQRVHLSVSALGDLAERVRTATLVHLKTDVKDRFAVIRDSLEEDDRALLVLRVDRGMSYSEIARVLSPSETSDEKLTRGAARLRKRLQAVKAEIRRRAMDAGLLPHAGVRTRSGDLGVSVKSDASDTKSTGR